MEDNKKPKMRYEKPQLEELSAGSKSAKGFTDCSAFGSSAANACWATGNSAGTWCLVGSGG